MGRKFYEHMGGRNIISCNSCDLQLSNEESCVSTHFQAASGEAWLFKKVVNYTEGEVETKQLLSGRHDVRDVYCKRCELKLGWKYEHADPIDQRYKEGWIVLECAFFTKEESTVPETPRLRPEPPKTPPLAPEAAGSSSSGSIESEEE